jgi:hypothetical protein
MSLTSYRAAPPRDCFGDDYAGWPAVIVFSVLDGFAVSGRTGLLHPATVSGVGCQGPALLAPVLSSWMRDGGSFQVWR